MWQTYRRRFVFNQVLFAVVCALMLFVLKSDPYFVVAAFLAMQLAAVGGAWWGHRVARSFDPDRRRDERLPLDK